MSNKMIFYIAGAIQLALLMASVPCLGQPIQDIYRITDQASHCHVEYHQLEVPKGTETVLADLAGPGKVTYF